MTRKILVNIEASSYCSASCSMCPRNLVTTNGFLLENTMTEISRKIDPSFVWEISFAGRGEPTLNKNLPNLLKIAWKTNIPVSLVTTGVLINYALLDSISNYVSRIRLSVSSIERSIFEKVHIGLDYKKIWSNIKKIADLGHNKTIIHLTGGPIIYDSLESTASVLRNMGFNDILLFPLWNRGGHFETNLDNQKRLDLVKKLSIKTSESEYSSDRESFIKEIQFEKKLNNTYCPVGDSSISISFNGDILGCFQDFGHTSNIGHISGDLIDLIKQRKKILGKMNICKGCDSYKVAII